MSADSASDRTSFGPTSGLATGVLGMALCLVIVVWTVITVHSFYAARIVLGLLMVAVVIWCYLLRPRVVLAAEKLELRNAFLDFLIPYAGIDDVRIRTVTRVYAGPKPVVGIGVGISRTKLTRPRSGARGASAGTRGGGLSAMAERARSQEATANQRRTATVLNADTLPDFVRDQIMRRADAARAEHGDDDRPRPERRLAVRELVLLGVTVVAFGVSLLV